MFLRRIGALAGRIIGQFRHDRRTLALVFVVPLVIMTILNFVLASSESNLKLAIVPPAEPLGTAVGKPDQERRSRQGDGHND